MSGKYVTIIGARPQFIKAACLSKELRKENEELIIHTGQHFDYHMSEVFFKNIEIPEPDYEFILKKNEYRMPEMIEQIISVLKKENPDNVIVYGDTDSTLAGALAAMYCRIPIVHIEAGLRSYNRNMIEENNRIIVDKIANIKFCSCQKAIDNLQKESLTGINVGDIMKEAVLKYKDKESNILKELNINKKEYYVLTLHRQENVDNKDKFLNILREIDQLTCDVIYPVHPRIKEIIKTIKFNNIKPIAPLNYVDMLNLVKNSKKLLTDSGGLQKESYWLKIPCVTIRNETEWPETLNGNWNILTDVNRLKEVVLNDKKLEEQKQYYGDGNTSKKIVDYLNGV